MKTRITNLLGIEYPIIQGAMAWVSESKLVSAMANAGATGVIATGGQSAETVREEIRKTRALTNKPFGVNVQLMAPNKDEIVDVICQEKVAFVTLGAGNPVPFIQKLKDAGVKVIPVVPSVKLAKRVEEAGADAIVIEGMEAGGHIGKITTMALMTQVIPAVKLPVIVAGGIADGRGMAAALLMGADAVQSGTRFLVAEECQIHPKAKQRIIEAQDTDSALTGWTGGHAVRGLKNAFTDKFNQLEHEGGHDEELTKMATGSNKRGIVDGEVDTGMVQAGQSLTALTQIEPAKVIVDRMMKEAKETLENAQTIGK